MPSNANAGRPAYYNDFNADELSLVTIFLNDEDFISLMMTERKFFLDAPFIKDMMIRFNGYALQQFNVPLAKARNSFLLLQNGQAFVYGAGFYQALFPGMPAALSPLPAPLTSHQIVDISSEGTLLTETGDVIFLNKVEHGSSLANWQHRIKLHDFYPEVIITQILFFRHRTYLLDAQGFIYQPQSRNTGGMVIIQLKKMNTSVAELAQETQIANMIPNQFNLLLLTKDGRVLSATPDYSLEQITTQLLHDKISGDPFVDVCAPGGQVILSLTRSGKIYCSGTNIKTIFVGDIFAELPDEANEPVWVEALRPWVITEIKACYERSTQLPAFYFKTENGDCFAIGNNEYSRFGNSDAAIHSLTVPQVINEENAEAAVDAAPGAVEQLASASSDDRTPEAARVVSQLNEEPSQPFPIDNEIDAEFTSEQEPSLNEAAEKMIAALIFDRNAWFLSNKGNVYDLAANERWQFPEPITKLQYGDYDVRGNYSIYALGAHGNLFIYKSIERAQGWNSIAMLDIMQQNKSFTQLGAILNSLQKNSIFAATPADLGEEIELSLHQFKRLHHS